MRTLDEISNLYHLNDLEAKFYLFLPSSAWLRSIVGKDVADCGCNQMILDLLTVTFIVGESQLWNRNYDWWL